MREITPEWLASQPTPQLARELLGARLQVGACAGLIVETEAYLGEQDRAAHAYGGRHTKRTAALYQGPGTIYVYQMRQYCLLNLVTQAQGTPECVLVRAIAPTQGLAQMTARRHQRGPLVTNGPGKLCQALAITLADNQTRLGQRLRLTFGRTPAQVLVTPRIGVPNKGEATAALLRYVVAGNPYVSTMLKKAVQENGGWLQ